jgi:hypothetical protein
MSAANGHSNGNSMGGSSHNGPGSGSPHTPYGITIAGIPLNGSPPIWDDQVHNGATAT